MLVDGLTQRAFQNEQASRSLGGGPKPGAAAGQPEAALDTRTPGKGPRASRRRGRPPKFGRPARLVAVTLPNDVIDWLASVDPDVGRAIVRLHDTAARRGPREAAPAAPAAELIDVGEGRALIVVEPGLVRGLDGVAAIPFGEQRAFLALQPTWTMADLELSVVDALDRGIADAERRAALAEFRDQLRAWRTDRAWSLDARTIIVASRVERKSPAGKDRARG